jgi:hypothetical protein
MVIAYIRDFRAEYHKSHFFGKLDFEIFLDFA